MLAIALAGCQPEQRPTTGETVKNIGPAPSLSVSGAVPPSKPSGTVVAAQPSTEPSPPDPDGIYRPTTNREIYQLIASDYQEIVALTNQVNEGKPLPSAEILKVYEEGKLARVGESVRPIRAFTREAARAQDFPEAVSFYNSPTFLDDPVMDAINGTGSAVSYSPAQRRQAIQKGLQRVIYHWSRRYVQDAARTLNPGLVDEAWAIYVGKLADGKYPNSLVATAESREANFNRQGSIDVPLRQALARAQQAAASKNQAIYDAAAQDVYARFHAIFYLGAARYLNEALKTAQGGNVASAGVQQIEGLYFYHAIQPTVAKADAAADRTIVAYLTAEPATLTVQRRDEALSALNRGFSALGLKADDRVEPLHFQ